MVAPMKRSNLIQPRVQGQASGEPARLSDNWKYDVNWDPIEEPVRDEPADKLVDEELERARALDQAEGRGNMAMMDEMVLNSLSLRNARKRARADRWPAVAVSTPVADHGRKRLGAPDKANVKATPRDVAVMSNSLHTIGCREKSLIRRPEAVPIAPSLNAMRLLLELLFHIRAKSDDEFEEFHVSVADLGRRCGIAYRMGRDHAEKMLWDLSSAVFIYRDQSEFVSVPYMAIAKLDHETGIAHLKLNSQLRPYLLRLKDRYRQLHRSVLTLGSARSMLLYMFARKFIGLVRPEHRVPIDELKSALLVDEEMDWATFRKDYLQPATDEINRKTEIKIDYSAERGARRKRGGVAAVAFRVAEHKAVDEVNKEMGKVLLIQPRRKVTEAIR